MTDSLIKALNEQVPAQNENPINGLMKPPYQNSTPMDAKENSRRQNSKLRKSFLRIHWRKRDLGEFDEHGSVLAPPHPDF